MRPMLVLLALASGCVSFRPTLDPWRDIERPQVQPDAPAQFLFRQERIYTSADRGTWNHRHEALLVINEAGKEYGQARLAIPAEARLVELQGRVIGPDGQVVWLDRDRLISDVTEEQDQQRQVFVFAFPDVQIGSVLELQYIFGEPHQLRLYDERVVAAPIPIAAYSVEVLHDGSMKVDTRVRHAEPRWQVMSPREGFDVRRLDLRDVPELRRNNAAPQPIAYLPSWAFVVRGHSLVMGSWPIVAKWKDAVGADAWYLIDRGDGFLRDYDLPQLSCDGEACIAAARSWLDRLHHGGFGQLPTRRAREVVAAGRATAVERARLLAALLAQEGFEPLFALTSRTDDHPIETSFPLPNSLQHVLVAVPEADGFRFIDPSCPHCELGTLPPWLDGRSVLLLRGRGRGLETEWVRPKERIVDRDQATIHYELAVDPSGGVSGRRTLRSEHGAGLMRASRVTGWTGERWKEYAHQTITDLLPTAAATDVSPAQFEDGTGTEAFSFSAKSLCTIDGPRMLVPLSLFSDGFADWLGKPSERKAPVSFLASWTQTETVVIRPPEGFVVAEVPPSFDADHPYLRVQIGTRIREGRAEITRSLTTRAGRYDLSNFAEARALLQRVDGFRQELVVLEKKSASL